MNFVCPHASCHMPSTQNFHRFEKYLAVKKKYVTAVNCHPSWPPLSGLLPKCAITCQLLLPIPRQCYLLLGLPINTTCPPSPHFEWGPLTQTRVNLPNISQTRIFAKYKFWPGKNQRQQKSDSDELNITNCVTLALLRQNISLAKISVRKKAH